MSNFPPNGPFGGGGTYGFPGAQHQYVPPPPPPNLQYNNAMPHQPYSHQRLPTYGHSMPPNGPMMQYANSNAFNNNAHYVPRGPNPSMPPQPMSQPYYGYGQYTNGMPQPFSAPAPVPTFQAAGSSTVNHRPGHSGQPFGVTVPSRATLEPNITGLSAAPNHLRPSSKGDERLKNMAPNPAPVDSPVEIVDSPRRSPSARLAEGDKSALAQVANLSVPSSGPDAPDRSIPNLPGIDNPTRPQESPDNGHVSKMSQASAPFEEALNTGQITLPSAPEDTAHMVLDSTPSSSEGEVHEDSEVVLDEEPGMNHETSNSREVREPPRHEKREAAKFAIRQLYDHNIGFNELLSEPIDASLLRELYRELGLALSAQEQTEAPKLTPSLPKQEQQIITSLPQPSYPSSKVAGPLDRGGAARRTPSEARDCQTKTVYPDDEPRIEAKATTIPNKPVVHELPSKPIERKDYIARLLAAKQAVRQQSNPKSDAKSSSKSPPPQRPSGEELSEGVASVSKALTLNTTEHSPDQPLEVSIDMKKPETKDPTQTELVRRRLEALKSSAHPQIASRADGLESLDKPVIDMPLDKPPANAAVLDQRTSPLLEQSMAVSPEPTVAAVAHKLSPITPDSSFYALGNQWSSGGLPGLSGTNFSEPHVGSHQSRAEISAGDQIDQPALPGAGFSLAQDAPSPKPQSPIFLESAEAGRKDKDGLPNVPPSTATRKRATAVDFLDGPPSSSKRQMVSNDPISLVIEVSDDEDDHGLPPNPEGSAYDHRPTRLDESILKSFRDGPPLSDLASKGGSSSKLSTPPLKSQNSKGLAQTEEEIRLLQQKIAAMEERKRAKQAVQVQTVKSPSRENAESQAGLTEAIEAQRQSLEDAGQQLVARQEFLAAAQSQMEESLETDQKNQATIVARIEAEAQAADQETSRAKRQARLKRKAQLEAVIPQLNAQIEIACTRLEDMIKQQEEIQAEIQRGDEGRRGLIEELDALSRQLAEDLSPTPVPKSPLQNGASSPVSDALDQQIPVGRSVHSLSSSPRLSVHSAKDSAEALTAEFEQVVGSPRSVSGDAPEVTMVETTMDISSSSGDEGQIFESHQSPLALDRQSPPEEHESTDVQSTDVQSTQVRETPGSPATPGQVVGTLSQAESPDMDDDAMDVEEDEDYDPVLDFEASREAASASSVQIQSDESEQEPGPALNHDAPIEAAEADQPMGQNIGDDNSEEEGEIDDEMREDSDDYEPPEPSSPVDDVPAAASPRPEARSPPPLAPSDLADSLTPESRKDGGVSLEVSRPLPEQESPEQPGPEVPDEPSGAAIGPAGHFTPYKSPLERFLSYRFHPEYSATVPGGYRSLTYNNKVDSEKQICRWELAGGVCNDASCEFQHFRDLPLTDNNILLQLGSVHEGQTPEEKERYIHGLKKIIAGMRDRNLKDVAAVAAEIVAYRAQFLGDRFRVLPGI